MGLRIVAPSTLGTVGRTGGWKDQCFSKGAPWATQRRSISFCSGLSVLWASGGGIRSSASVEKTRLMISLSSGLPGTMGMAPLLAGLRGDSAWSRRNLPFCFEGPWQWKQVSDMMGRMSRLKRTVSAGSPKVEQVQEIAIKTADHRDMRGILIFRRLFNHNLSQIITLRGQ